MQFFLVLFLVLPMTDDRWLFETVVDILSDPMHDGT